MGGKSSEIRCLSHGMTDARRLHGQILERQVYEARPEVLNVWSSTATESR